jgi:4-hydroxybenzoate polyprenyltransferase
MHKFLKQMRFYQFSKNLLVFVPLFSGHFYNQSALVLQFIVAFFAFCCISASGYILNDLVDLPYDRAHPQKRHRPLACGDISVNAALRLLALLIIGGTVLCGLFLPVYFDLVLLSYFALVLFYSHYLKRVVLLDVFSLALFYSLRIFGGMTLIPSNGFSYWLITFSFFFFLSLAYIKRYSELLRVSEADQTAIAGRDYSTTDLHQVSLFGTISAFSAVIILMLYLNSTHTAALYHTPQLLWLTCLVMLFWLLRIWTLVIRGQQIEDPIAFALHDKTSLWVFCLISAIYVAATL